MKYGASPEAWETWARLAGDDLLPSVANPQAEISPNSKLAAIGKVPSRYDDSRRVVGIGKWTSYLPSPNEIRRWAAEPDYAISVQTRGQIKAIDVDVEDPVKAAAIRDTIIAILGRGPVRYREGSGKFLIPIRYGAPLTKHVLEVDGGIIEILGQGQQFIADGFHSSGTRYQWNSAPIDEMQEPDDLTPLLDALAIIYGKGSWKIAREKRDGQGNHSGSDDVAEWLADNWEVKGSGGSGELWIECPFAVSHTTDSGPSSTAYFPAGTGGYSQGHFVCLHGHCQGREDRDYLDATGYSAGQFADLRSTEQTGGQGLEAKGASSRDGLPQLTRDKQGSIFPTADNLVKLCATPHAILKHLAFDSFKDEMVWAPHSDAPGHEQWRTFADVDYMDVRIELERRGCRPMDKGMIRDAVSRAAVMRRLDTAQEWLSRLHWDGVERIDTFCVMGWGWASGDYASAVGAYLWTAMAGRVMEPGCQVDMAPILVGVQGAGKTSAIKAMVPDEDFYTSVPLDGHDDDTARRLRGKLVGELEELRGLNSRSIEPIKAWITRTTEGWIPKYKEFESRFRRRNVFIGSTNEDEFLADPTGERRFLPGRCGAIDIDWIKAWRDQLWAEGLVRFALGGVEWQAASRLGLEEHHDYKIVDGWEPIVQRWLKEPQLRDGKTPEEVGHVTTGDVLSGAINMPVLQQDRGKEMRMAKVLKGLGWSRRRLPAGADGVRPWAYVKDASSS